MHARVTSIEWPAGEKVEGMDQAIQTVRDQIVPFAQQLQGFKGFLGLSKDGRIVLLSLWETEADLQASEAGSYAEQLKDKLAFLSHLHTTTTPLWLQDYEIFTLELS
jgi:hypothetical protein